METISPEYAALNADLHERAETYGTGGWRKADNVIELIALEGYASVLDYGCGKGSLARSLGQAVPVAEYDPAIAGKDAPPQPADLVVCLDVLEHVEPERLGATIAHLHSLSREELFATIATRPSSAVLADGRNAHLIIENSDWWRAQFSPRHWRIVQWDDHGGETWARLKPLHQIGHIKAKMAVKHEIRQDHCRENMARVPGRVTVAGREILDVHSRRAVLVCFGPSLHDTWATAALAQFEPDTDIFTVSGAHNFMLERGVIPLAHIDCDPRPHKAQMLTQAHPDVEYWLASCVHPSFIDQAAGGKITKLWHAYNGEASWESLRDGPSQQWMVIGGGSVGLRALSLLYYLGYRTIEVHGMDCSFRESGKQWAGEHLGKIKDEVEIVLDGGRSFVTAPALILYYRYFFKQLLWMHDAQIKLHGDGLLQHAMRIRHGNHD